MHDRRSLRDGDRPDLTNPARLLVAGLVCDEFAGPQYKLLPTLLQGELAVFLLVGGLRYLTHAPGSRG